MTKGPTKHIPSPDFSRKRLASLFASLAEFLAYLRSIALSLVVLATLWVIITEMLSRSTYVDPIDVPKSLREAGWREKEIAGLLLEETDRIGNRIRSFLSSGPARPLSPLRESGESNLQLPGANISVDEAARQFRKALGREQRITGIVTQLDGGDLELRLRIHGRFASPVRGPNINELVRLGAERVLEDTSPCLFADDRTASLEEREIAAKRCLEKDDNRWARLSWADILGQQPKKWPEAEEQYQNLTSLDPEFAPAFIAWGNFKYSQNKPKEAIDRYERAVRVDASQEYAALANMNWGLALVSDNKIEAAFQKYLEAQRLAEDRCHTAGARDRHCKLNGAIHMNRGNLLRDTARNPQDNKPTDECLKEYVAAERADPDSGYLHTNWGMALLWQGKRAEAIERFQKALAVDPTYADAANQLGNVYRDQEPPQMKDAYYYYEKALSLAPESAWAHYSLGIAFCKDNKREEAIAHLREAVRLNPAVCNAAVDFDIVREVCPKTRSNP